jgi:hypothetical protein
VLGGTAALLPAAGSVVLGGTAALLPAVGSVGIGTWSPPFVRRVRLCCPTAAVRPGERR